MALGRGGRLAFHGRPEDAPAFFGVGELGEVYDLLADPASVASLAARFAGQQATQPEAPVSAPAATDGPIERTRPGRQWAVLVRRNVDVLLRNRLTLAIMVGSPVLVIAMFTVLFRPGAFDAAHPSPVAAVSITYWLAFAAFFFGLTYGLLQVVTEAPILRRERLVHLRVGPYLLGKAAVLVPVLLVVDVAMLAVLRATDRLPVAGLGTYAVLSSILLLDAVVALVLGLLASAAATDPSQATLMLPMLCFPAVLFSGAVLPVPVMAGAGSVISALTSDRWAFEALGRRLGLGTRFSSVLRWDRVPRARRPSGGRRQRATGHPDPLRRSLPRRHHLRPAPPHRRPLTTRIATTQPTHRCRNRSAALTVGSRRQPLCNGAGARCCLRSGRPSPDPKTRRARCRTQP